MFELFNIFLGYVKGISRFCVKLRLLSKTLVMRKTLRSVLLGLFPFGA